ncbi:MAG: methyltransferase domain-containing protein, partial [Thermoplasmata archaeon]
MAVRRDPETREGALARLEPWVAKARRFSGWDFAEIHVRELDSGPPWDYARIVRDQGAGSHAVLDMGTGGGELLAALRPSFARIVVATEEWLENAPIAFHRLAPLGVDVVRAKSLRLPFVDAAFDLVINRHEEF